MGLGLPVVSAGAGAGYWESLLRGRGADVVAFDANETYPAAMRHTEVETGGPEVLLEARCAGRVLLLAWPDVGGDASSFGLDCVRAYRGPAVVHVGELFGGTCSADPWGQTTSEACQRALATGFRRTATVGLPNWPGHLDALTVWRRAGAPLECGGSDMVHV